MSAGTRPERRSGGSTRHWFSDWRVWLGVAVTTVALGWTLRDVPLAELRASLAETNLWWVALMLPMHVVGLWFRGVRWRYLAAPISETPLPLGAMYRATAVGFMAINIFPLRIGELIRPWFLSKETGVRGPAALGTLVLERAIDFTTLVAIGAILLLFHSARLPGWVPAGAGLFATVGSLPFLLAVALRRDEQRTLRLLQRASGVLPARLAAPLFETLEQVCRGLVAIRGGRAVGMVALWSVVLWGVLFAAPFAIAFAALGIDLPVPDLVLAIYTVHVFTALAVAVPSAPGFFGVYHFACREALALFGVSGASAVAYGTVAHMAYWLPVTGAGLLALARSGARMSDLLSSVER